MRDRRTGRDRPPSTTRTRRSSQQVQHLEPSLRQPPRDRLAGRRACTRRTADDSRVRCAARRRRRRRPAPAGRRPERRGHKRHVAGDEERARRRAPRSAPRPGRRAARSPAPRSSHQRPDHAQVARATAISRVVGDRRQFASWRSRIVRPSTTSALLSRPPKRRRTARPRESLPTASARARSLSSILTCAKPASVACSSPACIRASPTSCRRGWASTRTG